MSGRTLDDVIAETLSESDEGAAAFLGQQWLSAALEILLGARHGAGLTQAQVAERMGTTQSSVARLERDDAGGISLRRYLAYAQACGVLPTPLDTVPFERARQAALVALRGDQP